MDGRAGASSNPLSQPWTATRCHRLLRPLLTHISSLRKEANRQLSSSQHLPGACEIDNEYSARWGSKRPNPESTAKLSSKRARHTYSLKASKRIKSRKEPLDKNHDQDKSSKTRRYTISKEGMHLATPLVQRVSGHLIPPLSQNAAIPEADTLLKPGRCYHSRRLCGQRCHFEDRLAGLRRTTVSSTFMLYESIYRALDALLRATSAQKTQPTAPRSLLAMCLRKVPDYVAHLDFWKRKEADENGTTSAIGDSDVSFEIYSELESLGTGDRGWKHLSTVVQSHGIRIVEDAILEGLIDVEFSKLLAELCDNTIPTSDRRRLLEALVIRRIDPLTPCRLLVQMEDESWMAKSSSALLAEWLSRQEFPVDWILTKEFDKVWSIAVKDLANRDTNDGTMTFIITSIQLLCSHTQTRGRRSASSKESLTVAQHTLISAVAALASIIILGQETLSTDPGSLAEARITNICRRSEYIIRTCLARTGGLVGRDLRRHGTYVLFLAIFFFKERTTAFGTEEPSLADDSSLEDFWTSVDGRSDSPNQDQHYEATMALMSSIAQSYARHKTGVSAHVYLTKLCDKLEAACAKAKYLRAIKIDAAFYLADQTGDLWDLRYAEGLAAQSQADKSPTRQTPGKRTAFAGFRWDEGISEWVTATPALTRRKLCDRTRRSNNGLVSIWRDSSPRKSEKETAKRQEEDALWGSEDLSDPAANDAIERTRSSRVKLSSTNGKTCHAKKPQTQCEAKTARNKPGAGTYSVRRRVKASPRGSPGMSDSEPVENDVDELSSHQVDQEKRRGICRAAAVRTRVWARRKQSKGSLLSLVPSRSTSNEDGDELSSGDELAL